MMNIHVGNQIVQGDSALFQLTASERNEKTLTLSFLRVARLLPQEGITLPGLPEGRREAAIVDHGALTFHEITEGSPVTDTSGRLEAALTVGAAKQKDDDIAGFDVHSIDDVQGLATAYSSSNSESLILGKPFTVICDEASGSSSRFCMISLTLGTSALAKYTFYDEVWTPAHWSVLAKTLDHNLKTLVAAALP